MNTEAVNQVSLGRLPIWILTGGAASGKSHAAGLVAQACSLTEDVSFSADRCVHALLTDPKVVSIVKSEFGSASVSSEGEVDRGFLRRLVLAQPEDRSRLESILHPLVFTSLETAYTRACEHAKNSLFLAEIPLYFETGSRYPADLVITAACPRALQIERLVEGRGLPREQAEALLNAQMPTEEKIANASAVLWSAGSLASMQSQVDKLVALHSPLS